MRKCERIIKIIKIQKGKEQLDACINSKISAFSWCLCVGLVSQCTHCLRICLHQRFLLVTFNSHAHIHTHTQQPQCRRRLWRHFLFHLFFTSAKCKRYIFLLYYACWMLPLDRCSFFFLFLLCHFLSSIGFRCFCCCCRGQNPSNGFCDRFRTVAAGALCTCELVCVCVFSPLPQPMFVAFVEWMDGCPHLYLIEQCAYFFTVLWP